MTVTLGDFKTGIKEALGRGDALDAVISRKIRQAVLWIERNVDPGYLYMLKHRTVQLKATGSSPHIVDLPNNRVKAIVLFRLIDENNNYTYVRKISPQDETALSIGKPAGYWFDGEQRLFMDAKPAETLLAEVIWVEKSAWSDSDTFTHWLLTNAEDLLFSQTMLMLAPWTRDPKMRATFQTDRDEALITLAGSEIDREFSNTESNMTLKV